MLKNKSDNTDSIDENGWEEVFFWLKNILSGICLGTILWWSIVLVWQKNADKIKLFSDYYLWETWRIIGLNHNYEFKNPESLPTNLVGVHNFLMNDFELKLKYRLIIDWLQTSLSNLKQQVHLVKDYSVFNATTEIEFINNKNQYLKNIENYASRLELHILSILSTINIENSNGLQDKFKKIILPEINLKTNLIINEPIYFWSDIAWKAFSYDRYFVDWNTEVYERVMTYIDLDSTDTIQSDNFFNVMNHELLHIMIQSDGYSFQIDEGGKESADKMNNLSDLDLRIPFYKNKSSINIYNEKLREWITELINLESLDWAWLESKTIWHLQYLIIAAFLSYFDRESLIAWYSWSITNKDIYYKLEKRMLNLWFTEHNTQIILNLAFLWQNYHLDNLSVIDKDKDIDIEINNQFILGVIWWIIEYTLWKPLTKSIFQESIPDALKSTLKEYGENKS